MRIAWQTLLLPKWGRPRRLGLRFSLFMGLPFPFLFFFFTGVAEGSVEGVCTGVDTEAVGVGVATGTSVGIGIEAFKFKAILGTS